MNIIDKVISIIDSCENEQQLTAAENLVLAFGTKYQNNTRTPFVFAYFMGYIDSLKENVGYKKYYMQEEMKKHRFNIDETILYLQQPKEQFNLG